jgi:hypothetical protein
MNRTLKQKVIWFLDNLKLQIEDISLERDDKYIDIYFDTSDVRASLLGMEAFFNPHRGYNAQTFYEDRTLVQCLAAAGWLGQLQLLPPHQSEFLNLLNLDLDVETPAEKDPKARAQEFLYQIKVTGTTDQGLASAVTEKGEPHKPDIVEFVREHASSAINIFKAIQCIRGVNWQKRLTDWRAKGRLVFRPINFDYPSILNSNIFKELKKAFDNKRPESTINNFADAAAVVLLIALVNRYRKGETDRVPRFFVPTHIFHEAVTEAGAMPLLAYKGSRKGGGLTVLRNEDYFKFSSFFRTRRRGEKGDVAVDLDEEFESLNELRRQIEDILKAQEPLTSEAVDKIFFSEQPLSRIIEELQQLSFFENVWLPYSAQQEAQEALRELDETAQQLVSEDYSEAVEIAIGETRLELEENAKGYRLVSTLWTHLEQASISLHSSIRKDPGRPLDVFWDLGLLRFDFPRNTHQRITNVLEALFSGDEKAEREARISAITAYYSYARQQNAAKKEGDLILAAAVLWVTRMDKELVKLLEKVHVKFHYSLKIVYAASLFRLNNRVGMGQKVVEDLKKEFEQERDTQRRTGLAVGLAYLNFHLWDRLDFGPSWRPAATKSAKAPQEQGQLLINDAIAFAKIAYEAGDVPDTQKYVYALNQYLYYLVEGGDAGQLVRMKLLAERLADFKNDPNLWQYRFEDTLARYFHRLALLADSVEQKKELMTLAKRHIEAACEGPYRDQEVEGYRTMFDLQYASLISNEF